MIARAERAPSAVLSVSEVAQLLRVHVNTIKRIPPNELPYFRVGHRGDRRYWLRDVTNYIQKRCVG